MIRRPSRGSTEPLIGGESARLILDTLRTFPLSRSPSGHLLAHNTAVGETAEVFTRAYEQMEVQLITEAARCSHPGAHRTLHPEEYRFLVLSAMAADAKRALGEVDDVEGIWITGAPESPGAAHGRDGESGGDPG